MEHRTGKFGGFWYCKEHGTISEKEVGMIGRLALAGIADAASLQDDLLMQIERISLEFGVKASELESWIVDDPDAADYEPDHWHNIRPY